LKVLAIDYGTKRCGIAVGDCDLGIAHPLTTLINDGRLIKNLKDILSLRGTEEVIIGLPLNADGTVSSIAKKAIRFAHIVSHELGIQVKMVDERFTTDMAKNILVEEGISAAKRKKKVDKISASLILQLYFSNPSAAVTIRDLNP